MKLAKRVLIFGTAMMVALGVAFAEDDWDSDAFGSDDFGSGTSSESSSKGFTFGADAEVQLRYYTDREHDNIKDTPISPYATATAKAGYEGSSTDFSLAVKLNEDTIKTYHADIIDEMTANLYLGDWVLRAGKMRVVWGKGDKVHVLDNFNANDYTDFIIPDYIDRRISELMLRAEYTTPFGVTIEGIYAPMMTGDRYASSGIWKPGKVTTLENTVKQVEGYKMLKASGQSTSITGVETAGGVNKAFVSQLSSSSKMKAEDLYPDTYTLEYGQYGIRATGSIGQVSLGASYYYGHYKQVSVDYSGYLNSKYGWVAEFMGANATAIGQMIAAGKSMDSLKEQFFNQAPSAVNPKLNYDRLQVAGLEMETVVGRFGLRAEACYNFTDDTEGKARYIRNNSVGYLLGFDVNLPIHNVSLNVQEYGNIVMNADKIRDDKFAMLDADYDPTGSYTNNKLVVDLKDTFLYEKLVVDLKLVYGFERYDLIFMPSLSYKIRDSWEVTGSGLWMWCKDGNSEFYDWRNNSFAQLSVKYSY